MIKKKKKYRSEIVNTVIGEDTHFTGSLNTQKSVRIEGFFEGEIISQGEIFVGENSKVKANLIAKNVVVAGEVIGNIEAINGLEIYRSGRVVGDITGDHLYVEEGAIYKGRVNMDVISSKNDFEGPFKLIQQ